MISRTQTSQLQAFSGVAAPILIVCALAFVTALQTPFLQSQGWSPVGRNPVQWPSVMLLGPHGWLLGSTFVVCGVLTIWFSVGWWLRPPGAPTRWVSVPLAVMGLALMVVALPPEPGGRGLHDLAYPAIPLSWLTFAVMHGWSANKDPRWDPITRVEWSLVLPAFIVAWALTGVDAVAQLARFGMFALQLGWLATVALRHWQLTRREESCVE